MPYIRKKKSRNSYYYYLVKSVWDGEKTRQKNLAYLGKSRSIFSIITNLKLKEQLNSITEKERELLNTLTSINERDGEKIVEMVRMLDSQTLYITEKGWKHVLEKHPELRGKLNNLLDAILEPENEIYNNPSKPDREYILTPLGSITGFQRKRLLICYAPKTRSKSKLITCFLVTEREWRRLEPHYRRINRLLTDDL